MKYDILIRNCSMVTPSGTVEENRMIAVSGNKIVKIGSALEMIDDTAEEIIDGKDRLAMPGLIDCHTHLCQQLLRGRVSDEYPMRWTRFLVPFESGLDPEDVYWSAMLGCLEMIKSGTTAFADSGGVHMHRVADAVIASGMRAAIARSTMDSGSVVCGEMKQTTEEAITKTEELYREYQGAGDGRVDIWFALRQLMTCSPALVEAVGAKAKQYRTGIHMHLCEHKDEVSFCLQNYKLRPSAFLEKMGVLGPNLLTAHNVVLSEDDITRLAEYQVKVIHCPRGNLTSHGFSKTPQLLEKGAIVSLGTDGAASNNLNLFDEVKVLRHAMIAYWGLPVFDPVVMPCGELLKMITTSAAAAFGKQSQLGALEAGRLADLILIDISQPHLSVTNNLINTLIESADGHDVTDSVINGKIVMRGRKVLTIDEERVIAVCKERLAGIRKRTGV